MKLRQLEMTLQKLAGYAKPRPSLEQYMTPAPLAARLLYHALMKGDIAGIIEYDDCFSIDCPCFAILPSTHARHSNLFFNPKFYCTFILPIRVHLFLFFFRLWSVLARNPIMVIPTTSSFFSS